MDVYLNGLHFFYNYSWTCNFSRAVFVQELSDICFWIEANIKTTTLPYLASGENRNNRKWKLMSYIEKLPEFLQCKIKLNLQNDSSGSKFNGATPSAPCTTLTIDWWSVWWTANIRQGIWEGQKLLLNRFLNSGIQIPSTLKSEVDNSKSLDVLYGGEESPSGG